MVASRGSSLRFGGSTIVALSVCAHVARVAPARERGKPSDSDGTLAPGDVTVNAAALQQLFPPEHADRCEHPLMQVDIHWIVAVGTIAGTC